jgi:hypothetical protein
MIDATGGFDIYFGSNLVSWNARKLKQPVVSSAEA